MPVDERSTTIRQQIAEELRGGAMTAKDISRAVGIPEKEVAGHLEHVSKSCHGDEELRVEPSRCLGCGFVFRKRRRLKTPGRCPVCRSEEITETRFKVSRR